MPQKRAATAPILHGKGRTSVLLAKWCILDTLRPIEENLRLKGWGFRIGTGRETERLTLTAYADNIWVIGRTVRETKTAVEDIVEGMKEVGWKLGGDGELLINRHVTQRPPPGINSVKWNEAELQIVEGMEVLGFRLNAAGTDTDIRREMINK